MTSSRMCKLVLLLLAPLGRSWAQESALHPAPAPAQVYADDFERLSERSRDVESQQAPYTFCVRSSAVYECPVYHEDGSLHHLQRRVTAHGTAFAYRRDAGGTLLATNDHVAEWPAVSDDDHHVVGVPTGCRRVSDNLKIVDNDDDAYEKDDIPLTRVVTDPALDMAVVHAAQPLAVMPWKMGSSAALRERNVVDVRGFPLGLFKANNVGKVISAFNHDEFRSWDHDDFVVDALLSPGNSGSPVFAISKATGELELVGVYHAGYTGGSALNLVIGIDQVKEFLATLKRRPRAHPDALAALTRADRDRMLQHLEAAGETFFPLGPLTVSLHRTAEGSLLYQVFSQDFPFDSAPVAVLEDAPPEVDGFGHLGRVWFGGAVGLKACAHADLDAQTQGQLEHVLEALRRDGSSAAALAEQRRSADGSRARYDAAARQERTLRRAVASRDELAEALTDLAEKLRPTEEESALTFASLLKLPPPSSMVASARAQGTAPAVKPTGLVANQLEARKP